jgi:hypothetical protein
MIAPRPAPVPLLRPPLLAALALTCAVFAVAMYAASSGAAMALVVPLSIALLPVLLVLAWNHPLVFPYGAYAILIPFDLLLSMPQLGTAARLGGAVSGVALLLWLLRTRKIVVPAPALAAWLGLALWSCVSMLWAPDAASAAHECGTLAQLVLLYAIVSLVPATPRDVIALFGAVVVGGLIAACFGIREFAHPTAAQQLISQVSDRIPLLVGTQRLDVNEFADSLLLPLAIVGAATVSARKIAWKAAGVAAIGVLLYAMSLAASREAFVAVAVVFGYLFVVMPQRAQIGALGAGLAALVLANGNLLHRFLSASASGGSGRLSIWTAGLAAFKEHWLVGAGSGSFASAYDQVYLRVFQPYDMGWSRAAHNMLVQNGVEYGVVGLALLVGGIWLTLRGLPRLGRMHPLFTLRAGIVAALLGLCVAGFFVDLTTAKVFWLALSLIALLRACLE